MLNRSASTISREFQRNSTTGHYASAPAQQACRHRRLQARLMGKLHSQGVLFGAVEHYLRRRWSPEQIALASQRLYPKRHPYRMSHETIYNCIYAQPVGELRRDLIKGEANASAVGTLVCCKPSATSSTPLPSRCARA